MCSICGIIHPADPEQASAAAEAMNRAQIHRGPDAGNVWRGDGAVLGHRRLSIIDLAGGDQPMSNEDGSLQVVFNGEIYNHCGLREELMAKGHVFKSRCDTEVLLHLYEEKGDAFVRELDGMFAFALWDSRSRKVLLARDRAGQKPLHYFCPDGELVFASELAALRRHPRFPDTLDEQAVSDFLSLQFIPSPRTVYRDVKKLPPATLLRFFADTGKMETEIYWTLDYGQKNSLSMAQAQTELRKLLTDAVRKRLMSDVPFGVFLSGGVDSAVIAALMAELRQGEGVDAFTIGFQDPSYDERSDAAKSAAWIQRHINPRFALHEKTVDGKDFGVFENLVRHIGEPFADASVLPTALLSKFARESVTMALSGDAADELFGGYERYFVVKLAARAGKMPETVRRKFFGGLAGCFRDAGERTGRGRLRRLCRILAEPEERTYFALMEKCVPSWKERLAGDRLKDKIRSERLFQMPLTARELAERCMELDFHCYMESDILVKVDRASMASSLEVRNPFLDRAVTEFAASLPLEYKLHGKERKYILRGAFRDKLEPGIAAGRKRGFGIPLSLWLRSAWKKQAEEAVFDSGLFREGWVREDAVRGLWEMHQSGRGDGSYMLLSLIVLSVFLKHRDFSADIR